MTSPEQPSEVHESVPEPQEPQEPETRAARRARLAPEQGRSRRQRPRRAGGAEGPADAEAGTSSTADATGAGTAPSRADGGLLSGVGIPLGAVLTAALLALGAHADPMLLGAAVAWAGLVLAWGWPSLLGSPSRVGSSLAIAIAGVGSVVAVWAAKTDPYLRYVPVALALALLAMFLHQLVRRDGRPRLTESIAITAAGLSIAAIGACYIALDRLDSGVAIVTVSLAAVAAGSLADLLIPVAVLRPWLLPLSMLLGGGAATLTSGIQGDPATAQAVLIGFLVAAVSHAMRRVLMPLPAIHGRRGQITAGVASVLVTAVVAYTLAGVLVG